MSRYPVCSGGRTGLTMWCGCASTDDVFRQPWFQLMQQRVILHNRCLLRPLSDDDMTDAIPVAVVLLMTPLTFHCHGIYLALSHTAVKLVCNEAAEISLVCGF